MPDPTTTVTNLLPEGSSGEYRIVNLDEATVNDVLSTVASPSYVFRVELPVAGPHWQGLCTTPSNAGAIGQKQILISAPALPTCPS
jgi:hypothetical protein